MKRPAVGTDVAPPDPAGGGGRPTLGGFWWASLGLGAVGFGGGVSVLATIENLAVRRRRWMTDAEFLDTATVSQLLPGGAAANALAYMGLRFHGLRGAAAGYLGFILPGTIAILGLAYAYVGMGTTAHVDAVLGGLNAAVVGIIVSIAFRMMRTGVSRLWQMGVVAGALVLTMLGGAGSLEVILLGVVAGLVWDVGLEGRRILTAGKRLLRPSPPVATPDEGRPLPKEDPADAKGGPPASGTTTLHSFAPLLAWASLSLPLPELVPLAVVFFRVGLGAYGGGFAVIPSLHAEVLQHGWLTEQQFADAVAVGKLTPGPILLMATFIGFLRQGLPGAVVATVSILSAPFLLVVLMATWLNRFRTHPWVRAALRGMTPAVVGLMIAAVLTLGSSIRSMAGLSIASAVAATLVRFEDVNPVVMLLLGGAARLLLRAVAGI